MTGSTPEPEAAYKKKTLADLKDRGKAPASKNVLDNWITVASRETGVQAARLRWTVASTVLIGAIQRARTEADRPYFILKGGTYLQYRLNRPGRSTKDIDGIIDGDLDDFMDKLRTTLQRGWGGGLTFTIEKEEIIDAPKLVKPRRFRAKVSLKGVIWANIQIEISPPEGRATHTHEALPVPDLKFFGLASPDEFFGISLAYQIAQKMHASTDPHVPPLVLNLRARDLADLLLLQRLIEEEGGASLAELNAACTDTFAARALEAEALGLPSRLWPCRFTAHPDWHDDYAVAAQDGNVRATLNEAVDSLNDWVRDIEVGKESCTD